MSRYTSAPGTSGKIAFSPAGCRAAAKIWLMPMYDAPVMPTRPLLHG